MIYAMLEIFLRLWSSSLIVRKHQICYKRYRFNPYFCDYLYNFNKLCSFFFDA